MTTKTKRANKDRCTGHCCQMFTIPYSPEKMWASYHRWMKSGEHVSMNDGDTTPVAQDIFLIAPMLRYEGFHTKQTIPVVNPSDGTLMGDEDIPGGAHYYSCKHFDTKANLCTIYEHRPAMCRDYPNGKPCNYKHCTWTSHKAKKETRGERAKRLRVLRNEDKLVQDPGGGDVKLTSRKRRKQRS